MNPRLGHWRWPLVALAAVVVATGGVAYASIPDAGGVIHTCYTKSSGAFRVIDTGAGQTCKPNELPLDLYSKSGADSLFLGKTEKASDSDKLDGLDSDAFLGANDKAADSDKLDGLDSYRYINGADARVVADYGDAADDFTATFGHQAEDSYPGMEFRLMCDTDGATRLVVRSDQSFFWWWDDTFGNAPLIGSQYEEEFPIGNGAENHAFWSGFTNGIYITTLELNTSIGADTCVFGSTLLKTAKDSPGP